MARFNVILRDPHTPGPASRDDAKAAQMRALCARDVDDGRSISSLV
jgi:hypothetical protein